MHPIVAEENTPLLSSLSLGGETFYIYVVACLSAIGGFLFGYDTGIISGAMIYIKEIFQLNDWWQEAVVSSTLLAAWFCSILSGSMTDRCGRKPVIVVSSIIFVAGSLVMAFAWDRVMLLVGRLIVGAGVGLASMTVPMYIAEVAPSSIRGQLVMINMCCVTGGQFSASLIAYGFSFVKNGLGWRLMLGFAALPAAIQFLAFLAMPESPRWLIAHKKYDKARKVLAKIRPANANIEAEFAAIRESCVQAKRDQDTLHARQSTFRRIIGSPPVRRALMVGCLLQVIQQVSGINTVMYYSASIFEMSGVDSKQKALVMSAVTAFVNFACTLIGLALVERMGRRKLTLFSLFGVVISLITLGASFQFAENTSWLVMIGMLMYLFFFAPGMGPMPWTINSEIYPSWARSWCLSASTSACWLFNLLMSMTFLSLTRAITKYGAFYLYALLAGLGFIYFLCVLPETKGRTLEELEDLFGPKNKVDDATASHNNQSRPVSLPESGQTLMAES